MHRSSIIFLLPLGAILSACGIGPTQPIGATSISEVPAAVATANWPRAETISLTLSDFRFMPNKLELRLGAPYRLHLANASTGAHTFASESFFRAISVRDLAHRPSIEAAPAPAVIELGPGEQKDLYFVTTAPGLYDFECSKFLHPMFGMTGKIIVR